MAKTSIHGGEYPLVKVFSNDFVFTIPRYQRPYAWTTEQAGELLSDLLGFLGDGSEPVEDLSPYFLGSIVLIKGDTPPAEVVDGQQRLTTLTILLAVLRAVLPDAYKRGVTTRLYEEGDPLTGAPNRYRLALRPRDQKFFQTYIQDEDGVVRLNALAANTPLSDSQRNIRENARHFRHELAQHAPDVAIRLAQFLVTRCFLVIVSTPDFDSAYRIFSVLNDRGLDLSYTDILKAEIIGNVPEADQDTYTQTWENIEEALGREAFKTLFAHLRTITVKVKQQKTLLGELREHLKPTVNPAAFIDNILQPAADAFAVIRNAAYQSTQQAEEVNHLLGWLKLIDNSDWTPPAIAYLSRCQNDPTKLVTFFTGLERLAACLMIRRSNVNERIERYADLLTAIENGDDLQAVGSPLDLTLQEKQHVLQRLDGDLYLDSKTRLYVLLRLDETLSGGGATYHHGILSIEHVLPQNPPTGSQWLTWFSDDVTLQQWLHRLGNLVLLSRSKNSKAQNFDFATKKSVYFSKGGSSPFPLTIQVLQETDWTPAVVQQRQAKLLGTLKMLWKLT